MTEKFLCPNSGRECDLLPLCNQLRSSGTVDTTSYIDVVDAQLPSEVTDVLVSFCSNERILALTKLGQISINPEIRKMSGKRQQQITMSQTFFSPVDRL